MKTDTVFLSDSQTTNSPRMRRISKNECVRCILTQEEINTFRGKLFKITGTGE